MSLRFAEPLALFTLLIIPLLFIYTMRVRGLSKWRWWIVVILRIVVFTALIFALAEMEITRKSKELTVLYAFDLSESIPSEVLKSGFEFINNALKKQDSNSKSGLIVFGEQPSLESSPQKGLKLSKIESVVERERTNIASSLRLALAAFPKHSQKRIVLLSDGNENVDNSLDTSRMIVNNNAQLLIFPLKYENRLDLAVEKMVVPNRIFLEAPFDIKIFIASQFDTTAHLSLYEDYNIVMSEDVELKGGKKNFFAVKRTIVNPGLHTYRAQISSPADSRIENNTAYAFTQARGEPIVLMIDGDDLPHNYLADALLSEKIRVDVKSTDEIPSSLDAMQNYDAIILSNVHASKLNLTQMKILEKSVHDLGIGLVMIGGSDSFGAGGWQDTPVENALPVSMDIKQKKVLPNGALVIILHTCEIPDGNKWAQDISLAALNVLSKRDLMGVIYYGGPVSGGPTQSPSGAFGNYGERWLFPLQEVRNKVHLKNLIMRVEPGDMPSFDPTLKMAYESLSRCNCQVKHIVIISDGDPPPPDRTLANKIQAEKITISTIVIAPHSPRDADVMRTLANWGGGNFYQPNSATQLPKIFIKEASIVRKSLIFEEPFKPLIKQYSEVLTGFHIDEFPILKGYVCTTKKDLSVEGLSSNKGDPILAHWRYGVGKAVAFTSDATEKWAAEWITWNKYVKFWTQLIRWVLRETSSRNFQMVTYIEGGIGRVIIDAVGDDGEFLNFLEFDGSVINPELESEPVVVRQIAPGRYEGIFSVKKVGSYVLSLSTKDEEGKQALISGGTSLSYSPEFAERNSNDILLKRLAKEGGGKIIKNSDDIYLHNLPSGAQPEPIWIFFLIIALILLPFDIAFRRIMFEPAEIRSLLNSVFSRVLQRKRLATVEGISETLEQLQKVKEKTIKEQEKPDEKLIKVPAFAEKLRAMDVDSMLIKEEPFPTFQKEEKISADIGKTEPTVSVEPGEQPAEDSSMQRLMEAKKRAKKKMDEDKN